MCLRVDANGWGHGAGSHVSVYVHLMRGEYDSSLIWPFRGDITIQLVNHSNDQDHHVKAVQFDESAVAYGSADRVPNSSGGGDIATRGCGAQQFISHHMIETSNDTTRYLNNDCLTFRVTKLLV